MEFILGKDLDGAHYSALDTRPAVFGKWITGQNFIEVLETVFGLPADQTDEVIRIAQYQQALTGVDNGRRFYSASFIRDRFAAAARILGIRDEILMSAPFPFSLTGFSKDKGRLGELALVETQYAGMDPAPGFPERLGAVIAEVRLDRITNPIKKIFLTDPEASWQARWLLLFNILAERGTRIEPYYPAGAEAEGDLGAMQKAVRSGMRVQSACSADGSVVRINAHSLLEGADAAATVIDAYVQAQGAETVAVIREQYADILDNALERRGLPLIGSRRQGGQQGVLQVLLHLVLLLKKPVDPGVIRAFLMLPHCPVPAELREGLLRQLTFNPSITGWGWEKRIREYYAGHEEEVGTAAFLDAGRFPADQLRTDAVAELCDRLAAWAYNRVAQEPAAGELEKCRIQAELLKQVLSYYDGTYISSYAVQNILERIDRTLPEPESRNRQIGGALPVNSPGGLLSPVHTVVWWAAVESTVAPVDYPPWNTREHQVLTQYGVRLQNPRDELAARSRRWQRALLMARERLILVTMDRTVDDDGPHPFWNEMLDAFRPEPDPDALLTKRADDFRFLTGLRGRTAVMEHQLFTVPGYRQEWRVPGSLLQAREKESPSGLETFVRCPLQWVLRYKAGLTDPDGFMLPEGPRLMGSVAHHILERFLADLEEWPDPAAARRTVTGLFDRKIGELAGNMELPAWAEEREMMRNTIAAAAGRLVALFAPSGYRVAGRETRVQAATPAGLLEGRTDVILEDPRQENARIIIDLKMRSRDRYCDALHAGQAFQLAAYARILQAQTGIWPASAYFIIRTGELLTVHGRDVFPDCVTVKGPDEQATWEKLEAEVVRLREQAAAGHLPVGVPEEDYKKDARGPIVPAKCDWCDYRLFCGIGQDA